MQEFFVDDKYIIRGNTSFEGLRYEYLDKERGEVLEFKFLLENCIIYLRFYSSIVSFRHREMHSATDYLMGGEGLNRYDQLYIVKNSEYIDNINKISNYAVDGLYKPLTHYVVIDQISDYFFDVITNTEPEIIREYI